jgi:predicted Kef-type K+ transport protein
MRLSLPQLKLVAVLAHVGHRVLQPIHTVHHVNTKPFQTLQKRPVAYFQSIDLTAKPLLAYFQPLQSRKNVILLIAHHSTLPAMLLRLYHHTPSSG